MVAATDARNSKLFSYSEIPTAERLVSSTIATRSTVCASISLTIS